jgi:saposin
MKKAICLILFCFVASSVAFDKCEVCEESIDTLKAIIGSNFTEGAVEIGLKEVCGKVQIIPSVICNKFIEEYTPEILHYIVSFETTEEICQFIRLCPNKTMLMNDIRSSAIYCQICTFAISELEKLVESPKTEQDVKTFLDGMCTKLQNSHPELSKDCHGFVDNYIWDIVDFIFQHLPPDQLCAWIKICT